MTVNLGRREIGGLTAANPGDTLYIPFASFNDSGDSEPLSGLATTDIEIFKNGDPTPRATDSGYSLISDTGMYGNRPGLYRVKIQIYNTADDTGFFDAGSQYHVAIDSVTVDGKTVRFFPAIFETGRAKVNVLELGSDTGAANWLKQTYAAGFADTGINDRLAKIGFDVDTGLRTHISDVDTGLHDHINDIDTGLRDHVDNTDTGLRAVIDDLDTGVKNRFDKLAEDTGGVNVNSIAGDTGAANWLRLAFQNGFADTGLYSRIDKLAEDTGGVNVNSIQGDTGAAGWLKAAFLNGLHDTGLNDRLSKIGFDVDTGLRTHISDVDTGLHDHISDIDTGLRDHIDNTDTGLRAFIDDLDTGVKSRFDKLAEDTGGVNINAIGGDTGAAAHLAQAYAAQATNSDTGLIANAAAIRTKTDSLTFTTAGQVDANIQYVNNVEVTGTGASGDEWGP